METNNETIDDIIKDILDNDGMCISPTSLFVFDEDGGILLGDLAERIKMAHEREIGELKGERKGILKANESFAADNTRLREENSKLRSLVKGLLEAATVDCAECLYKCGPNRENCIIHEAAKYIEESEAENG